MRFAGLIIIALALPLFSLTADVPDSSSSSDKETENRSASELYGSGDYAGAANRFLIEEGRNALYNSARSWHEDYRVNGEAASLDLAVEGYYRVLELEPESPEARRNLELARLEQEKIQSHSEQREDGDSGDPSASQADRLNEMANRQQSLADNSREEKGSDRSEEGRRRQEELGNETRSAAEQNTSGAAQEALNEAMKEQRAAMNAMERGEDASEAQSRAAEALRRAAQASGEESSGERDGQAGEAQSQSEGASEESQDAAGGTEENSEGLPYDLQSMLNAEQDRKESEQTPDDRIMVEKNW